jgi:hypothetical protein
MVLEAVCVAFLLIAVQMLWFGCCASVSDLLHIRRSWMVMVVRGSDSSFSRPPLATMMAGSHVRLSGSTFLLTCLGSLAELGLRVRQAVTTLARLRKAPDYWVGTLEFHSGWHAIALLFTVYIQIVVVCPKSRSGSGCNLPVNYLHSSL